MPSGCADIAARLETRSLGSCFFLGRRFGYPQLGAAVEICRLLANWAMNHPRNGRKISIRSSSGATSFSTKLNFLHKKSRALIFALC